MFYCQILKQMLPLICWLVFKPSLKIMMPLLKVHKIFCLLMASVDWGYDYIICCN